MSIEVRRCGQCGTAAAVCIRDWAHTTNGFSTGQSTRDFCCQQCGHRFTLESKARIIGFAIVSVIFLIACIGFVLGAYTAFLIWPWLRNPVVPHAPAPAMRFQATEPLRRCTKCQGAARCTKVVRKSMNFIPTGTQYTYVCTQCQKSFDVASVGGIVFNLVAGSFLNLLGIATVMAGIGLLFLLFGFVAYGFAAVGIWRRWTNHVLPEQATS